MAENKSSIPSATTYEEMGAFWDEHDFTDFDDLTCPDVEFEFRDRVRIEPELLDGLMLVARQRGVSTETLVNVWLQKMLQQTPTLAA